MKAILEKVLISPNASFSVEKIELPHFISGWHYHRANEIILFTKSTGTGFTGDKICPFEPGMVNLLGAGLPHVWLNSNEYYDPESNLTARAIVIKFSNDFAGKDFFHLPEMFRIRQLLQSSKRGLTFKGSAREKLEKKIVTISNAEGIFRILVLIEILRIMSETDEFEFLSSIVYSNTVEEKTNEKISRIFEFVIHNFEREISLNEVSLIANMTPNSFCRFFKKSVLKSFKQFLNEVRIGNACKLIMENKNTISNAGYISGFNNLTHFHRQFKKITGVTPLTFQKKYWGENFRANPT
jgi:AraC-like DNA-binding protein